jgi:threonine/homoserine/homoserine lactone efflux protein
VLAEEETTPDTLADAVESLLADRARTVLARPRVLRSVDALAGVALVAFGLRLVLARC